MSQLPHPGQPDRVGADERAFVTQSLEASAETKRRIADALADDIVRAAHLTADAFAADGKLLLCGNGGSAADAQHLATEFTIRFRGSFTRPALPAIALTVDPSAMTAGPNDIGFEHTFARMVEAYGRPGDVLWVFSTSGKSANCIHAVAAARERQMTVVTFLGNGGGPMGALGDINLTVPATGSARVQEGHITIGHVLCQLIEERLYP